MRRLSAPGTGRENCSTFRKHPNPRRRSGMRGDSLDGPSRTIRRGRAAMLPMRGNGPDYRRRNCNQLHRRRSNLGELSLASGLAMKERHPSRTTELREVGRRVELAVLSRPLSEPQILTRGISERSKVGVRSGMSFARVRMAKGRLGCPSARIHCRPSGLLVRRRVLAGNSSRSPPVARLEVLGKDGIRALG